MSKRIDLCSVVLAQGLTVHLCYATYCFISSFCKLSRFWLQCCICAVGQLAVYNYYF